MVKKTKKKAAPKPPASRSTKKVSASRSTSKKTTKKSPARKKVAKKAAASKKKAPAKKSAVKKAAPKKKLAKKAPAKKKAVTKKVTKKKVTKKKTAKKKVVKKAAVKKAPAKKAVSSKKTTKKAAAKKASGRTTKKVSAKKAATQKSTTKKSTTKKFKPPRVPYAALTEAPAPAYNPREHEPLTNQQLRKIKTGLTAKDMRYFRQLLLERRAEIIGDVQGLEAARSGNAGEISHMPLHMADVGSDNYEQEFTLGLMEYERKIILDIDDALQRIVDKTYGVCIESGKPISRPRLEAKPWAKYSIEVARERERRGL